MRLHARTGGKMRTGRGMSEKTFYILQRIENGEHKILRTEKSHQKCVDWLVRNGYEYKEIQDCSIRIVDNIMGFSIK